MKDTRRNVLVAVAVGIMLAGCFRLPATDGADTGDSSVTAPGGIPAPTQAASPQPSRTGASGDSLEGRFTYQTMGEYVDAVVPLMTEWTDATWLSMPLPQQVLYVPRGAEGPESCLDGSGRRAYYSSASYEYCGADEIIYLGQDMLWEFYTRAGDAGPAVGLAHEFGHHIQHQVGVPSPQTASQGVRYENQADCIAGAWTKYMDQTNRMEYPDDLEDIDALFPLIGSAEGPDRDHGTTRERIVAFNAGFNDGLTACNGFFPGSPLISR